MLNEDQVQVLLGICERAVGKPLPKIRGDLRTVRNRAAAIWELLVLEAASDLGRIEYERPLGSGVGPDIYLDGAACPPLWLEVAYLYGREDPLKNDRRAHALVRGVLQEAERRGIPATKIHYRIDGEPSPSGPRRRLPPEQEVRRIARGPKVQAFLQGIVSDPESDARCDLQPDFTAAFTYYADFAGSYGSGGGLVEESPTHVSEHAVYRTLVDKADQHAKVPGPYVVCLGTDRSPAMGRLGRISERTVMAAAFSEKPILSGAVLVSIEGGRSPLGGFHREARKRTYTNAEAAAPLDDGQVQLLHALRFDRWRYSRPHDPWGPAAIGKDDRASSGGDLVWRDAKDGDMIFEIPADLLVRVLAGRADLLEAYGVEESHGLARMLRERWTIVEASIGDGNIRDGQPPRIVLRFSQPPADLFLRREDEPD